MSRENEEIVLEDGRRITYAEYGDPDGGETVFFFHGWPSSRLQGRLLDASAREHGLRVVSPDRPGMGGATFVPGRRLLDWPPVVGGLADALGVPRFSVLGLSGGGPYVLACAHSLPHRLHRAGIVCGAVPLRDFPDRSEMVLPYRFLLGLHQRARPLLKAVLAGGGWFAGMPGDHAAVRAAMRMVPECDRDVFGARRTYDCVMESYRLAMANGAEPVLVDGEIYLHDWGFTLDEVRHPIRMWHGRRDRNIPFSMARDVAERLPRCRAEWFDDEGHYSLPVRRIDAIVEAFVRDEPVAGAGGKTTVRASDD